MRTLFKDCVDFPVRQPRPCGSLSLDAVERHLTSSFAVYSFCNHVRAQFDSINCEFTCVCLYGALRVMAKAVNLMDFSLSSISVYRVWDVFEFSDTSCFPNQS